MLLDAQKRTCSRRLPVPKARFPQMQWAQFVVVLRCGLYVVRWHSGMVREATLHWNTKWVWCGLLVTLPYSFVHFVKGKRGRLCRSHCGRCVSLHLCPVWRSLGTIHCFGTRWPFARHNPGRGVGWNTVGLDGVACRALGSLGGVADVGRYRGGTWGTLRLWTPSGHLELE